MGLFNDAYESVAEAIFTLGRHDRGQYFYKPTPMGQRLQKQLEKYGSVRVREIEDALNEAAQQNLVGVERRLVSVDAPPWLHLTAARTPVIAQSLHSNPLTESHQPSCAYRVGSLRPYQPAA